MPESNNHERMPSQGGSHLRMPDGELRRVAGTDLHESELQAAAPLLKEHAEKQAAAQAQAEAVAKTTKKESTESATDAAKPAETSSAPKLAETSAAPKPADSAAVPTEDGQAGARRGSSR